MSDQTSENNKNAFKVKIKHSGRSNLKMPIYCPNESCRMITSNLDHDPLEKYGVCLACYVQFIENREKPTIDVEFYQKRLQERGF